MEYLQTAFAERYGPPSDAAISLPLTVQWISSLKNTVEEEWDEHLESLSALLTDQVSFCSPMFISMLETQ